MKSVNRILFVVSSFSKGGPQALRFQNIVDLLKDELEIHILELHHGKDRSIYESGYWKHSIEHSWTGKLIHSRFRSIESTGSIAKISPKFLNSILKKSIRKRFFPDTFIIEKRGLTRKSISLNRKYNYSVVVASGFPFTTMILSRAVKQSFPGVKFIFDIGDPFYNNSQNGLLRNYRAKRFETKYLKYIDILIVTNKVTRQHYLEHFERVIRPEQIEIVQQGVSLEYLSNCEKSVITEKFIRSDQEIYLVYAGQLYLNLREPFQLYNSIIKWNDSENPRKLKLEMFGGISDIFKIAGLNISSICFKGRISNSQVHSAYFRSDIIVFIDNAFGLQTPGKIFEVAAIGKPVIFISDHVNSPAFEEVKDLKHIYFCRNTCVSIIEAINKISYNIDHDSILKTRENFSWSNRAEQYLKIAKEILDD